MEAEMRIIQRSERKLATSYMATFDYLDEPGCGWGYSCDESGNLINPIDGAVPELVQQHYQECLTGIYNGRPVGPLQIKAYPRSWTTPAVGLCNRCDREVVLYGFTNTCECGADYNWAGQELASREQWGEETGESLSDILSIP